MADHAKLSASKAHRWMACPGSIRLEAQVVLNESEESPYAREGTIAHEYAAKCVCDRLVTNKSSDEILEAHEVPFDMHHAIKMYIEHVRQIAGEGMIHYGIEARVPFDDIVPDGFGTCDAWVYNEHTQVLHIVDFKYGRGVAVSATNNPQLQLYAHGVAGRLELLDLPLGSIQMWIVQPRSASGEQISSDKISYENLHAKCLVEIGAAANLALKDDAPIRPGEEQCRWCPAKVICPALNDMAEKALIHKERQDAVTANGEFLSHMMLMKEVLTLYFNEIEMEVKRRLIAGEKIPDWRMIRGRSNRKWIDNASVYLEEILGEEAFDRKPIGITKASKLLTAAQINELTVKPVGQPKLVPENYKLARGEEELVTGPETFEE